MVASLVCSARITSTSFMRCTGLKKCMPMTRSGRAVAPAISVIDSAEVLVANTRALGADVVERAEELDLHGDLLGDRLDDDVAIRGRGEVGGVLEVREGTLGIGGVDLAAIDALGEVRLDDLAGPRHGTTVRCRTAPCRGRRAPRRARCRAPWYRCR